MRNPPRLFPSIQEAEINWFLIKRTVRSPDLTFRKFIFDNMPTYPKDRIFVDFTVRKQVLRLPEQNELEFESWFECGNLRKAIRVGEKDGILQYNLLLNFDLNTSGHTQWFYFKAKSHSPLKVRFNILNHVKPGSLFSDGMKPCVWVGEGGWGRGCDDIKYFKNELLWNPKDP